MTRQNSPIPAQDNRLTTNKRRARRRRWLDRLWYLLITSAGSSVIVALLAIFFYLGSEVLPLFKPVSVSTPQALAEPLPVATTPKVVLPDHALLPEFEPALVLSEPQQRYLLLAARHGEACLLDRTRAEQGCVQRLSLTDRTVDLTALVWLAGQRSLISGDSSGQLKQWFLLPDQQGQLRLSWVKPFSRRAAAIQTIAAEQGRSGFAVLDSAGNLSLFYANLTKPLWQGPAEVDTQPGELHFLPGNQRLLFSNASGQQQWLIDNRHPEISWRTLWQQVWYEGWQQPEYVWQTGSASAAVQGKYSLVPLTLGTLKAAFYAMLVAVPLAVLAALYTCCFLPEPLRSRLSQLIELLALFPTVIIGFLAAIWLAPALEQHLLALLCFFGLLPLLVFGLSWLWPRLPLSLQKLPGSGWELLLLLALLAAVGLLALYLGHALQLSLFDGSFRFWLNSQGIDYQQRNALLVGLAMGLAVMPLVYSVCFDVMSQIPRSLTLGASALGATPWQIIQRVILPLSVPGILAAVMLGLSRAIGETMIILMATGNTPITNFNLFEGLRSLTAALTIELPEAAVDSSHYRVLFLVAILLFVFTFTANTLADLLRQRLRRNFQRLDG